MRHRPLLSSLLIVSPVLLLASCASDTGETASASASVRTKAEAFITRYTDRYRGLSYEASKAEWASNTHIVEGDDTNARRTKAANEALAAFTGSTEVIQEARRLLASSGALGPLQEKQLEYILYQAANNPQTAPELVKRRIAAETEQTEKLYGFTYRVAGNEITPNKIDETLRKEPSLPARLAVWEASKEVGRTLGDGLENLRNLRNATVEGLGYPDYFSYQVSDYGMTTDELVALMDQLNRELRPLYRELHTYFRHELARRYGAPVPDLIPAHWLPNRWGQGWEALVDVQGFDLDGALKTKEPEWLVRQAERFYVSLGFEELPASFYERSSLYPAPPDADYKKNNHASAWHLDLDRDVRCLMSVEPNSNWFETTHHELGHIYYYLAYSTPEVPPLLRRGANRAYHEAIGSLLGLAAMHPRFAAAVGLVAGESRPDPIQTLLKESLNYVVFIPWSAGVMTRFEHDLYATTLPRAEWNARWWDLKRRYQGIVPPSPRTGDLCDPATKTHINNDAAQYYDYALSFVMLFQVHDHIARNILEEDPRDTNYSGRKDVGEFLRSLLAPGATRDWRELLEEATGSGMTARPMLRYFEPLMSWLKEQNRGRRHTLPSL